VNFFRNLLNQSESRSSTATSEKPGALAARDLLLVGKELAWVPKSALLAGRKVVHAATESEALALLDAKPFAGLIAGLPGIDENLNLLGTASARHPALACGLRSDPAAAARRAVGQSVIPPTESLEVFDDLVRNLFATARWGGDPAFKDLKGQIKRFPALPSLYTKITNALQKEDVSVESLAELIAQEPAISVKLLQVVNSPVFALRQRVTSIRDAANFLGMQRVRALVLSTSLIGQCDASRCKVFDTETFETYGLQIANWAAQITVGETGDRKLAEMAFTAGLLHQFGVLLLAANLPESYGEVLRIASEQNVSIARIEREAYGVSHAELAGFILADWHLPFPIVNAVGFYAQPSQSEETKFSPLTAVHLATAIHTCANASIPDFERDYITRLNLHTRLDHWSRTLAERPWPEEWLDQS
jgi:HD-like signal output (HDOD) protein